MPRFNPKGQVVDYGGIGDMNVERCIEMREKLIAADLANENTVFALNHFSHNGGDIIYDDFVKIVAYDGPEVVLLSKSRNKISNKVVIITYYD